MTVTANCKKAGGITSCLIIVKQTFRALAEQSGDERLLSALDPSNPSAALLAGIAASFLAFLVLIFIEETCWAYRQSSIRK